MLFFEIISVRYVPLAVVMFSLPYQFCSDGKFYYRVYLVCHSQMPSLQVVFGGVGVGLFFFSWISLFLFEETEQLLASPTTPICLMLKKKGIFSLKKKRKKMQGVGK